VHDEKHPSFLLVARMSHAAPTKNEINFLSDLYFTHSLSMENGTLTIENKSGKSPIVEKNN
jgi:hypothetical protein